MRYFLLLAKRRKKIKKKFVGENARPTRTGVTSDKDIKAECYGGETGTESPLTRTVAIARAANAPAGP